ncbi:hypothetical protein H4R24_002138 [Coemansia sp. RSA 988]|nr:hypothetical protein H4R24_002138 [Coemansia sp. RSA 988]
MSIRANNINLVLDIINDPRTPDEIAGDLKQVSDILKDGVFTNINSQGVLDLEKYLSDDEIRSVIDTVKRCELILNEDTKQMIRENNLPGLDE